MSVHDFFFGPPPKEATEGARIWGEKRRPVFTTTTMKMSPRHENDSTNRILCSSSPLAFPPLPLQQVDVNGLKSACVIPKEISLHIFLFVVGSSSSRERRVCQWWEK